MQMKKQLLVALIMSVFLSQIILTPSVFAQINELEWGVEVDEAFQYVLQRKLVDSTAIGLLPYWLSFVSLLDAGSTFVIEVVELDTIPENPDPSDEGPFSYGVITRENDSLRIFEDNSTAFILPIGNWQFLTDRLNLTQHPEITLIDNDEEWGTIQTGSFTAGANAVNYFSEWRYEKENGTLSYVRVKFDSSGINLIDVVVSQWHEGVPTTIPPEIESTMIMGILIAISIGVIIAICTYKSYTSKKPLVQQLGE
ncbi:MAG: hypothetical protein ACTSU3_00010 [Candidatus Thorarchaeota archaeon]